MPEYAFPYGVQIRDVNIAAWSLGVHISLAILLISSLVAFVWRCRLPAKLWDIPAWIATVGIGLGLAYKGSSYPLLLPHLYFYVLGIFLTASVAISVTLCRHVNRSDFAWFLLILWAMAPCFVSGLKPSMRAPDARRSQCKNHLHNLGLAMHNYHDTYSQFPLAGIQKTESEAGHSWRVSILPIFGDSLIDFEYRFDEPWNSENNAALQKKMPLIYQCPSDPTEQPFTDYAMLTGPGTFGGNGLTGLSINEITDGTSNTIMIVEACGCKIIWTEPRDVEVTDESLGIDLPGDKPGHSRGIISSYHPGGAHVVFADGTVRFLNEKIDPAVLKALTTIDGGETLPADW